MHRWCSLLLLVGVLFRAHPSHAADETRSDQAAAESLFSQGRTFLLAGELERACEAFAASQKLDPAAGTLLNWARCLELRGLTASAWSTYASAEALAARLEQPERAATAEKAKSRLAPLVPHVVIELERDDDPNVSVELDGSPLLVDALALPLAIDPGQHRVLVSRGSSSVSREFEVGHENTADKPLVLRLEAPPPAPTPAAKTAETSTSAPSVRAISVSSSPRPEPPSKTWLTPTGWVSLGIGIVATAVGAGLVVDSYSRASNAECSSDGYCTDAGLATRASARGSLVGGYVVGCAGLALSSIGVTLLSISTGNTTVSLTLRGGAENAGLGAFGAF